MRIGGKREVIVNLSFRFTDKVELHFSRIVRFYKSSESQRISETSGRIPLRPEKGYSSALGFQAPVRNKE
jgi:hypothetical protein